MQLPTGLESINAFICEKILQESDGVLSSIRIVDVFNFVRNPDIPIDKLVVNTVVVVNGVTELGDSREHAIRLELVRPDGEVTTLGEPFKGKFAVPTALPPGVSVGFTVVAHIGIIARQTGTHWLRVYFDGHLVTKVRAILLEQKTQTDANQQ